MVSSCGSLPDEHGSTGHYPVPGLSIWVVQPELDGSRNLVLIDECGYSGYLLMKTGDVLFSCGPDTQSQDGCGFPGDEVKVPAGSGASVGKVSLALKVMDGRPDCYPAGPVLIFHWCTPALSGRNDIIR